MKKIGDKNMEKKKYSNFVLHIDEKIYTDTKEENIEKLFERVVSIHLHSLFDNETRKSFMFEN